MHGDDVASAGVNVAGQMASKNMEVLTEILKLIIYKKRESAKAKQSDDSIVLSGGEVTYRKLKEGGDITSLPGFAKEDCAQLIRQAKKLDIPVAAMQENGKENTVSVFFNVKDKEAVNAIIQDILREKLAQPEQSERMITIEKEQVEGFQMYCAARDIPVNFMESKDKDSVKCIFGKAYEKQMEAAQADYQNIRSGLSKTAIGVQKSEKGKPKIVVTDSGQGKSLTMHFCTKAKLERVLQERLGYSPVKAVEAANALTSTLTDEQKAYYLSGSRLLEQMAYYEKDIKFENENVLTDQYSFCKMRFQNEDSAKLTVTDEQGRFVVFSDKTPDRREAERNIRRYLQIDDSETVRAILDKAEKLGFVEAPELKQFKAYSIVRETQSTITVTGGNTAVRLDLSDKLTARKQLMDSFGMSETKADRIIEKARKQSVANNLLQRAKEKVKNSADTLRNKKIDRGSRK